MRKHPLSRLGPWLVGGTIVAASAWLTLTPRLHGDREVIPRAACAANLRGIGQALKIYAAGNEGAFPPDLETLIQQGLCTRLQLLSPPSKHMQPACDYYYVTGLTDNDPDDWMVAYGEPAYMKGAGANILYLDGHVEFIPEPRFTQEIDRFKRAYERARATPPVVIPPH